MQMNYPEELCPLPLATKILCPLVILLLILEFVDYLILITELRLIPFRGIFSLTLTINIRIHRFYCENLKQTFV